MKGVVVIGRPKGAKNIVKPEDDNSIYKCCACGNEFETQKNNFYYTRSQLFNGNNHYSAICQDCLFARFKEIEVQTGSTRMALICICHLIDAYYNEKTLNNMISNNTFSLGDYLRTFTGRQWGGKSFITNILQNDFATPIDLDDGNLPVSEDKSDVKNRNYVISQLGYDPFPEEYPVDRKFLFNTLSEYLTDEVIEDPHKLQSVVPLVRSILQESKIDRLINAELKNKLPNNDLLKSYMETKNKLRGSINAIANDNGISAKNSGRSARGANTLTGIMREMAENGFEEIKVNVLDAKMADAYKYIADISNKSLADQLNYQSDDYARMVATQREMIQKYENDKILLEEEIRLLKLENKGLKEESGGDCS